MALAQQLTPDLRVLDLDLAGFRVGSAQRSGPLSVIPLFGRDEGRRYLPPLTGLKLSAVKGYGNMELAAVEGDGVAIVPLQMGFIQDLRQNHALCASGLIGAGQKRVFTDACCVQQGQGGYLEGREQWFFVLPLALRAEALALRGVANYGKLWAAIARLNARFGLDARGHLEQIVSGLRAHFTQFASRFERLPGQTGALFHLGGRLAGIEIAPSAAYFAEVWMPLVCFCYGIEALHREMNAGEKTVPLAPFRARSVSGLREELQARRDGLQRELLAAARIAEAPTRRVEEKRLDLELVTVESKSFVGQVVESEGRLVYASIGARTEAL